MKYTNYREQVFSILQNTIADLIASGPTLDFGSGDGFFCNEFRRSDSLSNITPIDVIERDVVILKPVLYDGVTIPFSDRHFELIYTVDVLHHCPSPEDALTELARCSNKWILIKDHNYSSIIGWLTLYILDELGNSRFKIESPGYYQKKWRWDGTLRDQGFKRLKRIHPARCHNGLLGWLTNRFQYIDLWERIE